MIVGTVFGMFVPALIPKEHRVKGDPRILQIRTRRRIDLDRLRALYMGDELGPTVVLSKPSDFQFRAYCTPDAWGRALYKISMDINYINEKNPTITDWKDPALYHLYERIWSATLHAFPVGSQYHNPRGWTQHTTNHPRPASNATNTRTWSGSAPIRTWWDDAARSQPTHAVYRDTDHVLEHIFPNREPTAMELQEIADELERDERESQHKNILDVHYENMHTGPVVRNGRVDHSRCEHAQSKNARERCRRRLRKAGQL
jgi:hypothetical protein